MTLPALLGLQPGDLHRSLRVGTAAHTVPLMGRLPGASVLAGRRPNPSRTFAIAMATAMMQRKTCPIAMASAGSYWDPPYAGGSHPRRHCCVFTLCTYYLYLHIKTLHNK
uniref:Uncharacterized protein n=1 Tax=Anopheles merus TaxID=30066 RepID=A0A182V6W3_ANOME